jgi:hypothetical protein
VLLVMRAGPHTYTQAQAGPQRRHKPGLWHAPLLQVQPFNLPTSNGASYGTESKAPTLHTHSVWKWSKEGRSKEATHDQHDLTACQTCDTFSGIEGS